MEPRIKTAFEKLINSELIKDIYPMVDHIDITDMVEHPLYYGDILSIKIFLNDPSITKDNMFQSDFDPHYLADKHIRGLSKYLGLDIVDVTFKVYNPDGKLIFNWS